MMQVPAIQSPQYQQPVQPPNYNAVKIDINNPQVNATPGYSQNQAPMATPVYNSVPTASVYEMPQQSIYQPQNVSQPSAIQEAPMVPPPVIVTPTVTQTPIAPTPQAPSPAVKPETAPAAPQTVEVKAPETVKPQVDLNDFINKLTSPDYEVQANAMEEIASMTKNSPQKATELLDVKVIDTLLGIMNKDTSKLEGPTAKQLEIREKIISGKQVTEAETAEANKISPMELAERNKLFSIYATASLQKLYVSEIEKTNNTVVPLTELPGAASIVEQVKNNPNPMIRATSIEALSYIQRPEYKQDLTTLFTVAKNDKDINVQQAADKALKKLEQAAAPTPASTEGAQKTA